VTQRIEGLEQRDAPLLARPLYLITRRMFGKVLTPIKVKARRPLAAWLEGLFGLAVEKRGRVEPRLQTLVQLRAAQIVECPF
jgi:hypothetical protein